MSDSNDEYREVVEGVALQIGDSVVAYTYPLTEGLIVNRRSVDDGCLELTLLIAPHKKKGKTWSRAKITIRDAARLSKKPPGRFSFPIKGVEALRAEAKRMRADPIWVAQVKAALDKDFAQGNFSSGSSESDLKGEEMEDEMLDGECADNNQPKASEDVIKSNKNEFEKRLEEVKKFRDNKEDSKNERKKKKVIEVSDDSDYEHWRKWRRARKRKKEKRNKRRKDSSSASSTASSSSSSSSSFSDDQPKRGKVCEKGTSGLFSCPFNRLDSRGFKDVRCQIQGQTLTRKNIRMALHNLYADFHTLSSFADQFVTSAYASPYRPYTMDTSWFKAYAEHLDTMLLNALSGPWSLWNEPVVDQMATGFLELMIRVSPSKDFPACLDDAVRRWMKKKRIGTNSKFGPVSYAMQHAKYTEGGAVVQQSNPSRNRDRVVGGAKQGLTNSTRTNPHSGSGGDKRPPPPN